jgi:hypothetical protein
MADTTIRPQFGGASMPKKSKKSAAKSANAGKKAKKKAGKKNAKKPAAVKNSGAKKKAKKKPVFKKIKLEPKLSSNEVTTLLAQVQSEERSERIWQEMTSIEPDGSESLRAVEEKLIKQPDESKRKTWKYFGK